MKSIDILAKIFGSASKVKIMRLFLFNPDDSFGVAHIARKTNVKKETIRRELSKLQKIGLIKKRSRNKSAAWVLDEKFLYIKPLREFLVEVGPLKHSDILDRFKKTGQIKLILVAGVFINDFDSRVDLLVVGDKLKKRSIEAAIKNIETELGKELRYAYFETKDFEYRLGMYDKLLRDILDYSYQTVLNKYGDLS